jgi:hydroxymethylbilane synthase
MVAEALRRAWPDLEIITQIIRTRGDERTAEPLDRRAGRKGLFTGEIEETLAANEIDVAVHSAKDLPSEMASELIIAGALPRAAVEDVLITRTPGEPAWSAGATVATGSVRRQHQLRWKHPGIQVEDLRGNVPTRLRKFVGSDWDAIVLARAGIERLGYDVAGGLFNFEGKDLHAHVLASDDFLPAGGQGIIAMQVRGIDEDAQKLVRAVSDAATLTCLEAEREILRLLQGDCDSPVGTLATISGAVMTLRTQLFEPPRIEPRAARVEGPAANAKELARELWEAING